RTKAIDNHCHAQPVADVGTAQAEPPDPVGKSPAFLEVRLRDSNPEWIEAWRALYGYPHQDATPEHVRELLNTKKRLMREKGEGFSAWALDQAGIEVALVNVPERPGGQSAHRFRWVPFADGLLFPFEIKDPTGNTQRRRKEIGLDKPPGSLSLF